MNRMLAALASAALLAAPTFADVTVKATNKLPFDRPSQTIEIPGNDLASLNVKDLNVVHVQDEAGKELLAQAVDTDFDERRQPDIVIFQADFKPNETKTFTLSAGKKQVFREEDFKAYGRFVRERFDDYAWENDRVAFRTYGKALETWTGDPLTSSTIDLWCKRTPKMVINRWYMHGDYHTDHGEGADFYSAGRSRGCGGNGLWADGKLWTSKNFVESRTLASGPIRVLFELEYEPFDVNGRRVSEVKRISLDAGQHLNHIVSTYWPRDSSDPLVCAIGMKRPREKFDSNPKRGWATTWEKVEKKGNGSQGLAIIVDDPSLVISDDQLDGNVVLEAKVGWPADRISYRSGFFWDKANHFSDYDAWKKYVDEQAQGIASPIAVALSK